MIGAERHTGAVICAGGFGTGGFGAAFDEPRQGRDALLDLIAAIEINFIRTADRVADVLFIRVERVVELPQQKSFFRRLGIQQRHRVHVAVRHAEDVIGLVHQVGGEQAAALMGNINANLLHRLHGIRTGRLAVYRPEAR